MALSDLRKFAKVEVFNARNAGEKKNLKTGPDALKVKFVDFKKISRLKDPLSRF